MRSWLRNHWFDLLLVAGMAVLAFPVVQYLKRFIEFPFPLEYREASTLVIAQDFLAGANPYLPAGFPDSIYVYGWIFPAGVAALARLLPPALAVMRLLSALAVGASSLFLLGILRSLKTRWPAALAGTLVLSYALCVVLRINGARPDLLGMAFMLGGFWALARTDFSGKGLAAACAFWLAAFYTKQYLAIPIVLAVPYLFLFRSKKSALQLGGIFLLALAVSAGLVQVFLPLYFRYALLHHVNNADLQRDHLVSQLSYFLQWFFVPCVFYLMVFHRRVLSGFRERMRAVRIRVGGWEDPLLPGAGIGFWDFGLAGSAVLLVGYFGWHTGNTHVYFLELLLPFLLIALLPGLDAWLGSMRALAPALAAILLCLFPLANNFATDFPGYAAGFRAVEKRLNTCSSPYAAPLLAEYLLERGSARIYENGASDYAWQVTSTKSFWLPVGFDAEDAQLQAQLDSAQAEIRANIMEKKFDCIAVLNTFTSLAGVPLADYYVKERAFSDILEFDIIVWVPRPPA